MTGELRLWGRPRPSNRRRKYHYVRDRTADGQHVLVKHRNTEHLERIILARKLLRMKFALETDRTHHRKSYGRLDGPFHENLRNVLLKKMKNNPDKRSHRRRRNVDQIEEGNDNGIGSSAPKPDDDLVEELKQCESSKWKRRILKAANSPEALQILANRRVFTGPEDGKTSALTALLESMQTGIHNHDWPLACKCAEGLAELCKRNSSSGYWLLWNGGFLALANAYKNDVNKLVDFAELARSALGAYPRRLGIEIGTWLTQKGHFSRGRDIINEWHEKWGKSLVFRRRRYQENPKRYQVELIASLIEAVHSYVCWKRAIQLFEAGQYYADRSSIRRIGEESLVRFESLIDLAQKVDADVTIFIEPLIELTAELKTEFAARETFLSLVIKNERNFVLEAMYLKFIQSNFDFLEEEIELFTERRKFYSFSDQGDEADVSRLRNWKKRTLAKEHPVTFRSRPLPSFSI